jgi:peroxiredoxin
VVVIGLIVFGLSLWSCLPSTSPPAAGVLPQQIATVNGVAITEEMVDRELKISRLNVASPLQGLAGDDLRRAREDALNQLITRQLILQAAGRRGFRLDPDFIEEQADLLFGAHGDKAVAAALSQAGASRADLLWWVGEIFTVEEFTTKVIMAGAAPEERQQVYNEWLNAQRAEARIETYVNGQAQTTYALTGKTAPDFSLTSLEGRPVSLSDHAGKVVLINFWATWCSSCLTEMLEYEQVYRQYSPEFIILGVNLAEAGPHVQQYITGLGLTFPVLLDEDGQVTTYQYRLIGMPGSFIIDQHGKIFYQHIGPMSADTLVAKLEALGL